MELFKIERYLGDPPSTTDNSAKEILRMKKLLERANGRKRQREGVTKYTDDDAKASTVVQSESEKNEKVRKLKRKKLKRQIEPNILLHGEPKESTSCKDDSIKNQNGVAANLDNIQEIETSVVLNSQDSSKGADNNRELKSCEEITVIGGRVRKEQPNTVRRILPTWLANPFYFADNVQDNLLPVGKLEILDKKLVAKLQAEDIQHFFPVQQAIIPEVLSCWEERAPFGKGGYLPPDICVCAPTGSGKTLAYVLPVVQLLQSSVVRQLEALIIVPTKDLATQVWRVFKVYVAATGLKVGLANGLKSLQREQQQLGRTSTDGYSSHVNILVATPGRLVEHISSSAGFHLQFLRFFVIDEADRLLAEPYFGWLSKVYNCVYTSSLSKSIKQDECRAPISSARVPPQLLTPFWSAKIQRPLQKLLFSATLTQNPEKLSPLQLYRPKFFTVSRTDAEDMGESAEDGVVSVGQTPATLQECMYICNSGGKPLVLLYLLAELELDRVLCFTSSIETTHRLFLLVKHFGGISVAEFSSTLTGLQRQAILNDFNSGKTKLIICSDAMARGLDLQNVQCVLSYDPPVSSKTYIHRVGRTARAGKTGEAITLLHDTEVFHFRKMLKTLNKLHIPKYSVKDDKLVPLTHRYEEALTKLKDEVISDKKPVKRTQNRHSKKNKP